MNQIARLAEIPLSQIQASNFNPRQYFDVSELNDLADSINEEGGVIQPILVRPIQDDNYEIVAGERRWRASHIAGRDSIDCKIEEMDDKTALRRATKENLERQDMSAIEEAYAAQTALTLEDNNRTEAARTLSWSESKLSKRLLLLNLSSVAQESLMRGEIKLGHAELLSSLTSGDQDNAVSSIIKKNISVADLKDKLAQFSYKLETAIFDTGSCNGCPHSTSSQFALFSESIGEGRCTNPPCWDEKEASKFAYIKKAKEEDYNVVYLDIERMSSSYNYLFAEKMGDEQYTKCQQCGKCGALINTKREFLGDVDENVCFDTDCYKGKVKQIEKTSSTDIAKTQTATKSTTKPKSKATTKKISDNKPPKKVLEFKTKLFKSIVSKELITDRHMMTAMNACVLLESLPQQHSGSELIKSLQTLFKLPFTVKAHSGHDRYKTIPKLLALSDTELNEITAFCTSVIIASGDNSFDLSQADKSVEVIMETMKPDLTDHFTMDREYLECNQKTGIVALLKECGFSKWFDAKDDSKGAFAKLSKGTVSVILDTFTKSGFPIKGFIPTALHYKGTVDSKPVHATATEENS